MPIADQEAYQELCYYTLAHRDPAFIHQHVVDAFAAQDFKEGDQAIRLTFALVGLYLHVEKHFTGKQVQEAHIQLGRHKRQWPLFALPRDRGAIRASAVVAKPAGPERDRRIHKWCASVWDAFRDSRGVVMSLLREPGMA